MEVLSGWLLIFILQGHKEFNVKKCVNEKVRQEGYINCEYKWEIKKADRKSPTYELRNVYID